MGGELGNKATVRVITLGSDHYTLFPPNGPVFYFLVYIYNGGER